VPHIGVTQTDGRLLRQSTPKRVSSRKFAGEIVRNYRSMRDHLQRGKKTGEARSDIQPGHGITVDSPEAASRTPGRLLHPNELFTGTSISLLAPSSSYT